LLEQEENHVTAMQSDALPSDIRAVGDMKALRQAVKTHYFSLAFSVF